MIYSVDQVAQERGYPLSRQCHQYLEGSFFFFFLLMILTCLTLFFSQNDFLERTLNKEFLTRTAWCQANTLSINYSKSKFMVFKPRQKRQNFDIKLEISDCAIERVRDIIFFMLTTILLNLAWKHFPLADYPHVDIIWCFCCFIRVCFVLLAFYPNLYFDMISPLIYCIYSLLKASEGAHTCSNSL